MLAGSAMVAGTGFAAAPPALVLRRGVNTWPWFSLTREFPPPRTDYAWPPFQPQRPSPSSRDLDALRRTGLDFIRLPVDPGPFLSGTVAQRNALLNDLKAAVAGAHAADLAVVVNIQANGATHYWTPERMYGSAAADRFPAYLALAGEVAGLLGGFDSSRVALEPVNEPPQSCAAASWFDLQTALLTAARKAAPAVTLVATGGCGSMVAGLDALDPAPLLALEPLLFTFHFYEPYLFSHQGAPWMREPVYRSLNAVPWPASAGTLDRTLAAVRSRMALDRDTAAEAKAAAYAETERVLRVYFDAQPARPFIDRYLGVIEAWGARHGIASRRILMGEFGALRSDSRYVASGAADRARYIRDVREAAERFGFPWAFWNLFDGMGLMDDTTRALDPAIIAALGLTMPPP